MKKVSVQVLLTIVAYFTVGLIFQVVTCATWDSHLGLDGALPDIPCAGATWTPIILLAWPILGFSNLMTIFDSRAQFLIGDFLLGLFTAGAFIAMVLYWVRRYLNKRLQKSAHARV